jgi:hypothetical protein
MRREGRRGGHPIVAAALLLALGPVTTAQLGGGTTTKGAAEQIERGVRRPLPPLGPAPAPRADSVWVPDRWMGTPDGVFRVPGHWEQRRADGGYDVPPLTACDAAGRCVNMPAGVKPPVEQRVEP